MQRIIFFTADELATPSEIETIEKLNSLTTLAYSVHVRNSKIENAHGSLEESDLVAGSIPEKYKSNLVIDADALPVTLSSGETIEIYTSDGAKSEAVSVSIENGSLKASLPSTTALVKNNETLSVNDGADSQISGSHRVIVGSGSLKYIKLDSSVAALKDGDYGSFLSYDSASELINSAPVVVKDSKLKGISIPENMTLVKDSDLFPMTDANGVSLGSVKVVVSKNKVATPKLSVDYTFIKNGDTIPLLSNSKVVLLQAMTVNTDSGKVSGAVLNAGNALVKSADSLAVQDSNGTSAGNGQATVTENAVTSIKLDSTRAVINPGATVPVQNSAGTAVENASVSVSAGKATVKLSSSIAPVKNGAVLSLPVVISSLLAIGTATKSVTLKVENGVITGITI